MCLLDATYKTTKYSIPLFFVATKTNVDYQVIASFAAQNETTKSITEILNILKTWNPNWEPNVFFVDNCEKEIQSLEFIFPSKFEKYHFYHSFKINLILKCFTCC